MTRFALSLALAAFATMAVSLPAAPGRAQSPDIAEKVTLCVSCHGEDGRPVVPDVPIIFGQEFYYLYVQLKDYAAGRREHDIMTPMAAELSKDEMKALAQHFSEQPWPSTSFQSSDAEIAAAQSAASAGQCVQCHLGGYNGESRVPRLAGQKVDYLEATMLAFKHKDRKNAAAMMSLFESYDEASIAALADYLAGL